MKFNDGYWLLREGVTARYASEALDVRSETESASIAVLTRPADHRGPPPNTATIPVGLSAPASDVIAVRASHFVSEVEPSPRFELTESPADARGAAGEGTLRLVSGRLAVEAAVAGEWSLAFTGDGAPLT